MKTSGILLRAGGAYHLLCAVMHVFFARIFEWDRHLAALSGEGSAVIGANLNIMNWCMLVLWVMLGAIPLVYGEKLLESGPGKMMLVFIVIFWFVRIFVLQPVYVGFSNAESLITAGVFLAGAMLFVVPLTGYLRQKRVG